MQKTISSRATPSTMEAIEQTVIIFAIAAGIGTAIWGQLEK